MSEKKTLMDILVDKRKELSGKQRKVCDDMIEHISEVSVLTVSELAARNNVGTTTIMRTIHALGFERYPDFKREAQKFAMNTVSPTWWHLQKSFTHIDEQNNTLVSVIKEVEQLLNETTNSQNLSKFTEAVKLLMTAERIHVLGLRTVKSAAIYFETLMLGFNDQVVQLSNESEHVLDRVMHMKDKDVLLALALSPYATRTLEAVQLAHKQGRKIILITDLLTCPAASLADVIIHAKGSNNQYSIIPLMTIIEALIIEIGKKTSTHSLSKLDKINEVLQEHHVTTT